MIAINPQFDWRRFGGNALQDIGVGLTQSPTVFGGLARGAQLNQANQPYRDQQATLEEEQKREALERNQTSEWIKANFPQYSNLPTDQAWQAAMGDLQAQRSAASGGVSANYGLTPVWGTDASGNPVMGQMSSAGGIQPVQMPEGVTFGKEPIRLDAGNHFVLLDPVTRQTIGTVPKSGEVPTGYEPAPGGGISPMPGGPQATEVNNAKAAATRAITTLDEKNKIAMGAIDKALSQANSWNTGNVMGNMGAVPILGQGALDLGKTLDTIKANIGFEELQTMRDNSPTGGALGQVTERELAFLQSTIANIEQSQSEQQLRQNLAVLKDYLSKSGQQRRAAFEQQFGGNGAPTTPQTSTGISWSYEP